MIGAEPWTDRAVGTAKHGERDMRNESGSPNGNDTAPPKRVLVMPILATIVATTLTAQAATLEVGPGKTFSRIEAANDRARPGDVVLVYPRQDGKPYEKTAVYVRQRDLAFRAAVDEHAARVKISGDGFDYSGRGSIPRAIFQFNPGADRCMLEGFELSGAHNGSHNGAGVRINQANHVTVRNCDVHGNDMGVMSGGDGTGHAGVNQRIEHCAIHHNGNFDHPGFNHNLYLGGTSVTLSFCDVHSSLTGHNVKSRAHFTCVQYSYVHHSANREFDLVDSADTARPNSHAVLMGSVIVKDPQCKGNRGLVHFGQDGGGHHNGAVHLVYNTIVDPFITPLVELSSPQAKALLVGNLVSDGGVRQNNQKIAGVRHGAKEENVTGTYNWFSGGFSGVGHTRLDPDTSVFRRVPPGFEDPARHDYRPNDQMAKTGRTRLSPHGVEIPWAPGMREDADQPPLRWQYRHPTGKEERPREKMLTFGAHGR
jgi:hypothetical protein